MPSLEESLVDQRVHLADQIKEVQELSKGVAPPVVQEIILAQRALEDARMRLGVALAYEKDLDPFRDRPTE